jgi:hypothetical protein
VRCIPFFPDEQQLAGECVCTLYTAVLKQTCEELPSSFTTWMMGIKKESSDSLRAPSSRAIHSFPFTGSVKWKHAPPLELFSAQIRPP